MRFGAFRYFVTAKICSMCNASMLPLVNNEKCRIRMQYGFYVIFIFLFNFILFIYFFLHFYRNVFPIKTSNIYRN